MTTQHTPGPWELDGIAIAGNDPHMGDVCLMGEPAQYAGDTARMCDNYEANARLIAAAPDLLAVLRTTRNRLYDAMIALGSSPEFATEGCREADAAIAKARGQV